MVKDHPDGGNIAILDFPSNESCVDRVNGFLDDLESFVTQFVGTNAYMAGQLVGEQMVKDHPDGRGKETAL